MAIGKEAILQLKKRQKFLVCNYYALSLNFDQDWNFYLHTSHNLTAQTATCAGSAQHFSYPGKVACPWNEQQLEQTYVCCPDG